MTRVSRSQLLRLADVLSPRDRAVIEFTARFRLVSGTQVERLFFADGANAASNARLTRRTLARLTETRVLVRLERRIGGVRAGSAGSVYCLGVVGDRLLRYWRGEGGRSRSRPEPGRLFTRHTLAVTSTYVGLREAERAGALELLAFDPEPASWRPFAGAGGSHQVLKPDAYASLGVGSYEDRYFIEIDCGTEGRGALSAKCRIYLAYYRAGIEQAEGVFPRVLWITTTERRRSVIVDACASLPGSAWPLFAVVTPQHAERLFRGYLDPQAVAPGRAA